MISKVITRYWVSQLSYLRFLTVESFNKLDNDMKYTGVLSIRFNYREILVYQSVVRPLLWR